MYDLNSKVKCLTYQGYKYDRRKEEDEPEPNYINDEWQRELCLYVRVDGVEYQTKVQPM